MERPISTLIITQARTGSSRLPGKVLMKVNGEEILKIHLDRLKKSKLKDHIIVATTEDEKDDIIESLCQIWGVEIFRGDENDALDRFYQASKDINPEWVVRVTSDCPLVDPELIDAVILCAKTNNADYCSNGLLESYPDGQDVEVFKFSSLKKAWKEAKLNSEREHVTPYMRTHSNYKGLGLFQAINFPCIKNYSKIRMTVDEIKDFEVIKKLIEALGTKESWLRYTHYIINEKLYNINSNILRNEGYLKSLKND